MTAAGSSSVLPPGPPSEPPQRLRSLPTWLFNHLAARSNRLIARRLSELGRRSDYAILASLQDTGPASQAELARRLTIDRGDLVGILRRLHATGLTIRDHDLRDRRRNTITITDAGRRKLRELEHNIHAVQEDLLAPLSPEDRMRLIALLQRLLDAEAPTGGPM